MRMAVGCSRPTMSLSTFCLDLEGKHGRPSPGGGLYQRLCVGDACGYKLYTLDHDLGTLRLDLEGSWADSAPPRPLPSPHVLLREPPVSIHAALQTHPHFCLTDFPICMPGDRNACMAVLHAELGHVLTCLSKAAHFLNGCCYCPAMLCCFPPPNGRFGSHMPGPSAC